MYTCIYLSEKYNLSHNWVVLDVTQFYWSTELLSDPIWHVILYFEISTISYLLLHQNRIIYGVIAVEYLLLSSIPEIILGLEFDGLLQIFVYIQRYVDCKLDMWCILDYDGIMRLQKLGQVTRIYMTQYLR